MKDTLAETKVVSAVTPAVKSAAETGFEIDLRGYGSALLVIETGAIASNGDFGIVVEESDGMGSPLQWDAVDAADLIGTIPATLAASSVYRIGYRGKGRLIHVKVTKAGGVSIALGAVAVLGHPHMAPVA